MSRIHLIDKQKRYVGSVDCEAFPGTNIKDPVSYNGVLYASNGSLVGNDWIMYEVTAWYISHEMISHDSAIQKLLRRL